LAKKEAAQQKETAEKPEKIKPDKINKEKKDTANKETAAVAPSTETPVPAVKPATKSTKIGKLLPKNKSRLPRKEKKARQKAAGRL
jgi:hypothetical protein